MADAFLSEHWNEFGVSSARDAIIACLHALLLSEKFTYCPSPVSLKNALNYLVFLRIFTDLRREMGNSKCCRQDGTRHKNCM